MRKLFLIGLLGLCAVGCNAQNEMRSWKINLVRPDGTSHRSEIVVASARPFVRSFNGICRVDYSDVIAPCGWLIEVTEVRTNDAK